MKLCSKLLSNLNSLLEHRIFPLQPTHIVAMAAGRSAATKIDWAHITTSLGLKGSTATSLQAFKKRNDDARRRLAALSQQPQSVDFSRYRSTLNNTAVVDEIEQHLKGFKPVTYDVGRQLKAIEAFEAQAVKSAEETKGRVDREVEALEKTLTNIETARPFEDLTVRVRSGNMERNAFANDSSSWYKQDEVAAAEPEIDKRTEQLVSNGRWEVKGYKEKFGDLSIV
ncbi:MAG: hypothetical protein Q9170_008188 [Blastenia crenularia]